MQKTNIGVVDVPLLNQLCTEKIPSINMTFGQVSIYPKKWEQTPGA